MMHKRIDGYKDSYQNVSGILLTTGPVFTYIDYALGKNHSWLVMLGMIVLHKVILLINGMHVLI